jgi:EAL domain-containing protein (putative c-di-GMP-specific phosphodiesterase class I)/GGDEF domain-containing protein
VTTAGPSAGELLPAGHAMLIGMAAGGAPLSTILDAVVELVEAELPDSICTVLLLDADGVLRLAAAPTLPLDLVRAHADGIAPGEMVGSCGSAVHRRRPVLVADILVAEEWVDYADRWADGGVRACWSVPIFGVGGSVLGSFAVYRSKPGLPSGADVQRIAGYAGLVALAVQHDRSLRDHDAGGRRDPVTGLPTGELVPRALEELLNRSDPDRGEVVSCTFVGLGRLGECNRALGYSAGNELLRLAGDRLTAAAAGAFVARPGGGTFAVLAVDGAGTDPLARAHVLLRALAAPYTVAGVGFTADPRIAVVTTHRPKDPERLLAAAADRLAAAKRVEHPTVVAADGIGQEGAGALALENELRVALDEAQLEVHYQPVVQIADGRVTGAEALVRWAHPTRGLLPPDAFLPIVDRARLHHRLTAAVLHTALRDLAGWRRLDPELHVAVNVSARELHEQGLVEMVEQALAAHRLPGSALCIELTEHDAVADVRASSATLRRLAALGVRIGMDDFGTGYSSLTHVRDLVVDHVKIDRSFVRRIGDDGSETALIAAIIGLANGLGLGAVAEGVETPAHRQRLLDLGCTTGQGYLWSRPVEAAAIAGMLSRR